METHWHRCTFYVAVSVLLAACLQSTPAEDPPPTRSDSRDPPAASPETPPNSGQNTPPGAPGTPSSPATSDRFTALANLEVNAALFIQHQHEVNGLLSATTYFCSSPDPLNTNTGNGSITVSFDDVDPPGQSTGDKFAVAFNACRSGNQTLNGTSSFTVDEISGTPYAPAPMPWRVSTTHAGDLLTSDVSGTQAMKTSFHFTAGTGNGVAYDRHIAGTFDSTGSAYTLTTAFENGLSWNLGDGSYSQIVNTQYALAAGAYRLETLKPLTGLQGQTPNDGVARVSQEFGSTRLVTTYTVLPDGSVKVELDSNGDGVADASYEQPWSSTPLAAILVF